MGPRQSLDERLRERWAMLVRIVKVDYGYDLQRWHDHLKKMPRSESLGYTWNQTISLPKVMHAALADDEWQKAVALAKSGLMRERLNKRDKQRRDAIDCAEREWAGKSRHCSKCNTEFTSVRNRGQCTNCSHIFYAGHPNKEKELWWLEIT